LVHRPPGALERRRSVTVRRQTVERKKRGGTGALVTELLNCRARVLETLHHHPLQSLPEHRFYRAFEARRHVEEIGDGADHAGN
jgi:hypothetical protein